MNRRGFLGACAALLALPAVAIATRSVPGFIVDRAKPVRLHFSPFGELDWIDMPSNIVRLRIHDEGNLLIECVDGNYLLHHAGEPERDWLVARVA